MFFIALAIAAASPLTLNLSIRARGDRGHVYCAMWRGREGFPTRRDLSVAEGRGRVRDGSAIIRLAAEPGAGYAIACFHDENENQRLDTGFLGIPTEGTGASNDARPHFGPPKWSDAHFPVTATSTVPILIHY